MDLNKSRDYFNPEKVKGRCHIIGCGSVGSFVARFLVMSGVENITLYDDDVVEPHNLCNQLFTTKDIGKEKTKALYEQLVAVNPDAADSIRVCGRYDSQNLSGYVFLCVDNIEIRKEIATKNQYNMNIKYLFDVRTSLESGDVLCVDWKDCAQVKNYIKSTSVYTHEEVLQELRENGGMNACGMVLGVVGTVAMCSMIAVDNFINLINGKGVKRLINVNAFHNGGTIIAV